MVREEVFLRLSSNARTLFSYFHGLIWRQLCHAWSASGGPVRGGTLVARVSRSDLLAYCTPLHNFRYGIDIDIVGLTEKDIGFPWFITASYIHQLRITLDDVLGRYVPIHVFGCFDPQTIAYLFFAGADIFDGLAWMRYYFHNGHAFYSREFEYKAPPEQLLKPWDAAKNLLRHNVEELERLRTDLRYAVLTRDVSQFEECLENLKIFESTTVSQRSAVRKQR